MIFSKSLERFSALKCGYRKWANFENFPGLIRVIRKFAESANPCRNIRVDWRRLAEENPNTIALHIHQSR
ncbi:MAG: hypothetical protein AB1564_17480, partial [Chloroflexota bacterium]